MTIEQVHQMLMGRAKQFNESGISMIDGLEIAERTQVYLRYGYSTLWSYCEHALKLSPADTQRFLQVMRKAKVFPELKKAVVSGELSLPKAARIASQLTVENQTQWIETAVSLSSRKLDIAVKDKNPGAIPRERITPRGNDIFDFKTGLSKSALDKFNRVSDILSQKLRRPATAQEILEFSFDETLKKHDPIQKAQRNQAKKPSTLKVIPKGRVQHSSAVRHEVVLRDQSQCTAVLPNGTRCEQRRFLDIHHKIPLSSGGTNHPSNLALLCNGHHRAWHLNHEHESPRLHPR